MKELPAWYAGDGKTLTDRQLTLPPPLEDRSDPAGYLASTPLREAANIALLLGQPLLLTGDPGTGKTEFAGSLAYELGLGKPLVFNVKTTSTARDLFYRYDSLRHFHDSQYRKDRESNAADYLSFEALGQAILLSLPAAETVGLMPEKPAGRPPARSVVLIDEIDKAPRDLPNDILSEIKDLRFTVQETGRSFAADPAFRPIVVLTSNSEKNLPDAFLRRCVFHDITFPNDTTLRRIVENRLPKDAAFTPEMLDHAIQHFEEIRKLPLKKLPATAEFLSWIRVLQRLQIDVKHLQAGQAEALAFSYSILTKTRADATRVQDMKP